MMARDDSGFILTGPICRTTAVTGTGREIGPRP